MSTELPREHPSTYFVQDRGNQEEIERLSIQDTMVTTGMGGVLPEQSDPASLRRVLDVGCGTGDWLIETGRRYPTITRLVGIDISQKMLSYTQAKVAQQDLDDRRRVQFQTADALRALPFPNDFFDLVNQRFGVSWLRTWEWRKILLEYQRVCRPSGTIRITEGIGTESNSEALTRLNIIGLSAFHRSGNLWSAHSSGITGKLVHLLTQYGIQNVQSRVHTLVYSQGTDAHQSFYEDMRRAFHVALPFFQKWTHVPSDYMAIYEQAMKEIQEPGFVATATLMTAWGSTSGSGEYLLMRGLR